MDINLGSGHEPNEVSEPSALGVSWREERGERTG